MKRTKLTDLLLLGTAAALIGGCAPKRMDLYEAEMFKGNVMEFTNKYVKNEGALDAAETSREGSALKDMIGIQYVSKSAYLTDLQERVGKQRMMDIMLYGTSAVIVDGLKLYSFTGGGNHHNSKKSSSGGTPEPTPTSSMGPGGADQNIVLDSLTSGWNP